jgi:hypothetical protein
MGKLKFFIIGGSTVVDHSTSEQEIKGLNLVATWHKGKKVLWLIYYIGGGDCRY